MRILIVLALGLIAPVAAKADGLSLEDFAVFQGAQVTNESIAARREVVQCLQTTKTPRICIGATVPACPDAIEVCETREVTVWEHYGHDVYLALRRALGGPAWIDEAHLRLGGEMRQRCVRRTAEAGAAAGRVCALREAAGRALDLRFALVAP